MNTHDFFDNNPDLKRILLESKILDIIPGGFAIATDVSCEKIIHNPVSAKFLRIEPWGLFSHSSVKVPPVKVYRNGEILPVSEMPMQQAAWFGKEIVGSELEFVWEDGMAKIARWSASPLRNENGTICGCIATMEDITDIIHMARDNKRQQELILQIEKEKNESLQRSIEMKDEFFSLMSHEFKTPITVIHSAVQAIEVICKDELSDKAKGFLNKIRQNASRQLKLVNNLLDVTRANAGHIKVNSKDKDIVNLTKSITESVTVFAEQKNIKISFSSTLKEKVIGIDDDKYERILLNLLSNAIKFTPKGKFISVKVSQKVVKRKCMVCIQVIDKGIGIPEDKHELIFQRFGQVNSSLAREVEGTGIGLYLVRMFVELMGGEITLKSEVGKGSTFTILLPITKTKRSADEQIEMEITDNRLIQTTAIEFSDVY